MEKVRKAVEAAKLEEFNAEKQNTLMELNSATMQLKLLEAAAEMHAFHAPFALASKALGKKTSKLSKALEEYVCNPSSVKDKGVLVLVSQPSMNTKEREDHFKWAGKLGVTIAGTGGPAKKRKKA